MSDPAEGTTPTTTNEPDESAAPEATEPTAEPATGPQPAETGAAADASETPDAEGGAPAPAKSEATESTEADAAAETDAETPPAEPPPAAAESAGPGAGDTARAGGADDADAARAKAHAEGESREEAEARAAASGLSPTAQPTARTKAEEKPEQDETPEPKTDADEAAAADTAEEGDEHAAPEKAAAAAAEVPTEASAPAEGDKVEAEEAKEPEMPTDPVSLMLLEHLENGKPIQGKVFGWNQGGYHVLIDGLLAFCPRSEIDLGNPKAPKKYIEKKYPFRVIEHRPEGNRFIVSRAKILEEERETKRAAVKEHLKEGAELEGHVTSLTGFGAFVDLGGGIEGMVHVSELSHRSVDHPKDLVKKGQKVRVKVLKIEQGGDRISLSMKVLEPNPWKEFAEKHPRGSEFSGKITGKTDFGIFVEVAPGMEGLVHVSALPPGASLESEGFEEGKEVSGWVKDTEVKRKRISLSLKPVPTSDPWKEVTTNYPEGDVVSGTVEEIAPFGVFINLEPGLTGLLPNSEMNLPRGTHPGRVYSPGSEVKVQVGRIEPKRKRITLLPEGAKIEGSRTDYKEFKKKVSSSGGMPTLAAAFEKLKKDQDS
ncbi:MAG: S1 RNA-binding domain-containing protein [Acidobacteriota bacterium]|jgi:small subunit ribosomal protein S1